jgi:DNA-binding XRE family transcriptional regulator
MESKGYTPSKFAEKIGIQRAAMSHIISGRNNPSIDVYKKIIEHFKDIDPDWLLSGTGNMTRGNAKPSEPNLFANMPVNQPKIQITSENHREMRVEAPKNDQKQVVNEKVIIQKVEAKNISKIMIFYSDNTFDTFVPEKNKKD